MKQILVIGKATELTLGVVGRTIEKVGGGYRPRHFW